MGYREGRDHNALKLGVIDGSPGSCSSPKSLSPSPSPSSASGAPSLVISTSGKKMDQSGRKKYVRQVTGRHNDTEIHLAAQSGDLAAVRQFLRDLDTQMRELTGGDEFDAQIIETMSSIVYESNDKGETALMIAAGEGYVDMVEELLKYAVREKLAMKNKAGFDALHLATRENHLAVVKLLLDHDSGLIKTLGPSNATLLITAACRGHTEVVKELLQRDPSLLELTRSNGKNALHFAVRQGHLEIVQTLLQMDPQLARKADNKVQTTLHLAAKGRSVEVVKLLLHSVSAIVMLPDKKGNTALHVATRKKRVEIVNELLCLPDTNVNALTMGNKTALDIAEALPPGEDSTEIKECLCRHGALRSHELNQPRDELRKAVTEIKKDVHNQLEQTKKTNKNVYGIAKELRKLHREGINNATNSVTVVAVLFATVAFAAIFTVPGGNQNDGIAVAIGYISFKIFFVFNALALFTSLAVVVVQITLVRGETKSERKVIEVINKLMWLASICTSVAFMASSYIVVGRQFRWAAILVTVIGGVIMGGVLGTMTYYVVRSRRSRTIRKKEKSMRRSGSSSWPRNAEPSDSDIDPFYAI